MENLQNSPVSLIICAALYAATMKIADLLNEHGLKSFKGSGVIFGIIWGSFGIILILLNNIIGNIILAMNIAFIARGRLDYLNHQIASSMIIIASLYVLKIELPLMIIFYLAFVIFGSLKDYIDDRLINKNKFLFILIEAMPYYPIATLLYCLIYGNWLIFWTFLTYTVIYDLVKYIYKRKGYK